MQLFDQAFIGDFLLRYLHILVGIAWIGLLYYFNLDLSKGEIECQKS